MTTNYSYPFIFLQYACIHIVQKIPIMYKVFKITHTPFTKVTLKLRCLTSNSAKVLKKRVENTMLEFLLPEHALTTLAPKPFSSCVHVRVCVRKFNPTAACKNSFILKCRIICQHLGIWQYLGSRFHLSKANGLWCLSRWVRTSAKPVQVWGTGIYFASPEI